MVNGEVVDLCISTDDEKTSIKHGGSRPSKAFRFDDDVVSLPEQVIDLERGPRKKRKLSPPARNNAEKPVVTTTIKPTNSESILPTNNWHESFFAIDDDDPIVWTSSPKQKLKPSTRPHGAQLPELGFTDSDSSLPDEAFLRMAATRPKKVRKSTSQTTNLPTAKERRALEEIDPQRTTKRGPKVPKKSQLHRRACENSDSLGEEPMTGNQPQPAKAKKPKVTEEEKAALTKEKEAVKAAAKIIRLQQQEELKEQKRLLKEDQAREKQKEKDRAEANKLKLDKKLSTPEMIVDLPISIGDSTVDTQIRECLKKIGVEIASYQSHVPNLVKWRRKVESRFNTETGIREKLRVKEIDPETHVMCLMSANEFVQLATSNTDGNGSQLDEHVFRIRSVLKDCTLIYLIEGLDAWMRKNRNAKNRAYQAAVLSQPDPNALEHGMNGPDPASKRKKPRVEVVDEDAIEDSLVRLQVMNRCLVHHAAAPVETAEWVAHFTEQISQIPYRHEQMARESTFCMDSGQVKCGKDAEDTYINMLLANVRVTGPIAYGIAAKYPDVVSLLEGLEEKGPTALEHLKKSANKDGSLGERNIGPAISRRLHKVFTEADPSSTEI
ncbi:MAG: hypothetical protein Q9168_005957 [Polycauliona sp. 1 TL-2023]